jgi:hypothetical protein
MAGSSKASPGADRTVASMLGSLLHSTGMPALDAGDDFARARRAQRMARATTRLRGRRRPGHPATLPGGARPGSAGRLAVIALDSIVGTVEPSPHFDSRFRPASAHLRARWVRVALAHRRGTALPPIVVVHGPGGYYVVDGRHRVSVALARGRREIDAWVR